MKGRQVIRTERRWEFDELLDFLRDNWDESVSVLPKEFDRWPHIGRYIELPATFNFCTMVYPNKKGVVLISYQAVQYPLRDREWNKEFKGPAEEKLLMYTEYVRKLLERG